MKSLRLNLIAITLLMAWAPTTQAIYYGTHAYDTFDRKPRQYSKQRLRTDYHRYSNYYRYPAKYSLHPYFRFNYESALESRRGVRPFTISHSFFGGFPNYRAQVPPVTSCYNYSYSRANYREQPRKFRCR